MLYHNVQGTTFTAVTGCSFSRQGSRVGDQTRGIGTSLAVGDVNSDGFVDLVIGTGANLQNELHMNLGNGTFTMATHTSISGSVSYTMSAALGDLDGDGDLDCIFVGNGNMLVEVHRNGGDSSFSLMSFTDVARAISGIINSYSVTLAE